jgi:hypothetical protein
MFRNSVIAIALFGIAVGIPMQAQEATNKAENSLVNFHIGGGFGIPLNPTARFAGLSGSFQVGAGYNLTKHNSLVGEFSWMGLPPNRNALLPLRLANPTSSLAGVSTSVNLYTLTPEYMYHREGVRFGYYGIGGGGWYYRHASIKNNTIAPGTVCVPYWDWWGYVCEGGFVATDNTLATRGISSGGVNAGGGFTIRITDSGLKLYMEARYHYAPSNRISTQAVPVTFGFRW